MDRDGHLSGCPLGTQGSGMGHFLSARPAREWGQWGRAWNFRKPGLIPGGRQLLSQALLSGSRRCCPLLPAAAQADSCLSARTALLSHKAPPRPLLPASPWISRSNPPSRRLVSIPLGPARGTQQRLAGLGAHPAPATCSPPHTHDLPEPEQVSRARRNETRDE